MKQVTVTEDYNDLYDRIKGQNDGPKLADMEREDALKVYKRLKDEACAYVKAGLTLHQFYSKYEH